MELRLKASVFCFLIFIACVCVPEHFGDNSVMLGSRRKRSGGNGTLGLLSSGSLCLAGTQPLETPAASCPSISAMPGAVLEDLLPMGAAGLV